MFFKNAWIWYILLASLLQRYLLLAPGTIGHNWDWVIPDSSILLRSLFSQYLHIWNPYNLGHQTGLGISVQPLVLLLSVWGLFGLNGEFVSKIFVTLVHATAGLGLYLLIQEHCRADDMQTVKKSALDNAPAFFAGLFYGFSPFLFGELIGGGASVLVGYAVAPLTLLFFRRALLDSSGKLTNLFLTASFLSLVAFHNTYLVLVTALLVFYGLFYLRHWQYIVYLGILFGFFLILNAYWLLPLSLTPGAQESLAGAEESISLGNLFSAVPSLPEIYMADGFFRPFFRWSVAEPLYPFWVGAGYAFFAGIVLTQARRTAMQSKALYWLIVLMAFIPFATALRGPLPDVVRCSYERIPLMAAFRSPQKWMLPVTLSYAILLGFFLNSLTDCIDRSRTAWARPLVWLSVAAAMLVWLHPYLRGDLGFSTLNHKYPPGNYVGHFQTSAGQQGLLGFLGAQQGQFRVLFLPPVFSPRFLPSETQDPGQGGDPLVFASLWPTFWIENATGYLSTVAIDLETQLYTASKLDPVAGLLGDLNVRYLILRQDVVANFGGMPEKWNAERTRAALEATGGVNRVATFGEFDVFELSGYEPLISFHAARVTPTTDIVEASPTRYMVRIAGGEGTGVVRFISSFHSGWHLYQFHDRPSAFAPWPAKPVDDRQHTQLNGWANSWEIDASNGEWLVLDYWPQRLFQVGGVISAGTLIGGAGFLALKRLRHRRGETPAIAAGPSRPVAIEPMPLGNDRGFSAWLHRLRAMAVGFVFVTGLALALSYEAKAEEAARIAYFLLCAVVGLAFAERLPALRHLSLDQVQRWLFRATLVLLALVATAFTAQVVLGLLDIRLELTIQVIFAVASLAAVGLVLLATAHAWPGGRHR